MPDQSVTRPPWGVGPVPAPAGPGRYPPAWWLDDDEAQAPADGPAPTPRTPYREDPA